jgi:hypothetical protein
MRERQTQPRDQPHGIRHQRVRREGWGETGPTPRLSTQRKIFTWDCAVEDAEPRPQGEDAVAHPVDHGRRRPLEHEAVARDEDDVVGAVTSGLAHLERFTA